MVVHNVRSLKNDQFKKYSTFRTGKLPADLTCEHCVIQWHYHTANSWACDDTGCGLGYGEQEEFYGCADIAITNTGAPPSTHAPILSKYRIILASVNTTIKVQWPALKVNNRIKLILN